MTIAGTYSFSVTRDDIIKSAMQNIGKLGEAENPTAQETTDCAFRLNMMVKQWMGKADFAPGLKMWTRKRGDLFLSSSTGQYSLGPTGDNWTATSYTRTLTSVAVAGASTLTTTITNATNGDYIGIILDSGALFWTTINGVPIGTTITLATVLPSQASSGAYVYNYTTKQQRPIQIETIVLRDYNNDDTPVGQITLQEYEMLPSKVDPLFQSLPQAIYYEAQLTNGVLYTDVAGTSDVRYRLHIVYLNPVSDFNNPTDTPEYPQQWYMALVWGLAKQIAPMFNAPWSNEMQLSYVEALAMAKEQDGESTAMYFQCDA
jgi:hypothetical protein